MSHVTGCQKIRVPAAVIMVNWNSPRDTIESIESTLEIAPTDKVIVVVDNNSADLSADTIYNHFFKNGTSILSVDVCDISRADSSEVPKIILIRNDKNAGYAGGNNIAIKYILDHFSTDYIWLLNNDAVVDSSSLTEMLRLAEATNGDVCNGRGSLEQLAHCFLQFKGNN